MTANVLTTTTGGSFRITTEDGSSFDAIAAPAGSLPTTTVTPPVQQVTSPGGSLPSFTVEAPAFATTTGTAVKLTLLATGAATAGDVMSLVPTQDGSPIASTTDASTNAGASGLFALTMTWVVKGLTVGASHTYGFQVADSTGGHTFIMSVDGAYILVEELPFAL